MVTNGFVYNRVRGDKSAADKLMGEAEGAPCPFCDAPMRTGEEADALLRPTRDHLLPRSRGGGLRRENWLIVCAGCNGDKGDRTLAEWAKELIAHTRPDWARAERVIGIILDIYDELGDEIGDGIVTGKITEGNGKNLQRQIKKCMLPDCRCVGHCTYAYIDEAPANGK